MQTLLLSRNKSTFVSQTQLPSVTHSFHQWLPPGTSDLPTALLVASSEKKVFSEYENWFKGTSPLNIARDFGGTWPGEAHCILQKPWKHWTVLIGHLHTLITRKLSEISESKEHSISVSLCSGHWKIQPHTEHKLFLCLKQAGDKILQCTANGKENDTKVQDFLVKWGKKTKASPSALLPCKETTGHKDMQKPWRPWKDPTQLALHMKAFLDTFYCNPPPQTTAKGISV